MCTYFLSLSKKKLNAGWIIQKNRININNFVPSQSLTLLKLKIPDTETSEINQVGMHGAVFRFLTFSDKIISDTNFYKVAHLAGF